MYDKNSPVVTYHNSIDNKMRWKVPKRNLNVHKRHLASTPDDRVYTKRLVRQFGDIATLLGNNTLDSSSTARLFDLGVLTLTEICRINIADEESSVTSTEDFERSIESFNDSECVSFFRFQKADLFRLKRALQFLEVVHLSNRSTMSGEEVFLRGLFELVSGSDQIEIATFVFGRDQSQQSRAFSWFINHLYNNFSDLLTDNLDWWYTEGYLQRSMEAIRNKFNGNQFDNICAFIDCNCWQTCRPGGGPRQGGADAERWSPQVQRAFYNGWKSTHGLKHQTVDCAYGMTVHLYGPHSLRRNDLYLLSHSEVNEKFTILQEHSPVQLKIYGDTIYPTLSHVRSANGKFGTAEEKVQDANFAKVRISIEWNYGATGLLFGYLTKFSKLKLLGGPLLQKCTQWQRIYAIVMFACTAVLLVNILTLKSHKTCWSPTSGMNRNVAI